MQHYDSADPINVGTGEDLTIAQLVTLVKDVVYPAAALSFDHSKPVERRESCSTSHARLGWRHTVEVQQGVASTYDWYVAHQRAQAARPTAADEIPVD